MRISTLATTALAGLATASPIADLDKRQSTTWQYSCNQAAPKNFKAFDLGGLTAQLSFDKDRYIGVQWNFDAVYADGSRVEHKPFQDYGNFGPFLGNNFLTRNPSSTPFTAVHEFTNVCKDGRAPVAWVFYTTSGSSACSPRNYRYTTEQIKAIGGVSRPSKVTGSSIRKIDDGGNYQIGWNAVDRAVAYSVIVEYPSGEDEIGRPYYNTRGARIQSGTLSAIVPTTTRQKGTRKVIVHALDSQGVWSFTSDVVPVVAQQWSTRYESVAVT